MCRVLPRSTSEQKAHYLVHQLDSKTKLSKHTTHHLLIDVLHSCHGAPPPTLRHTTISRHAMQQVYIVKLEKAILISINLTIMCITR